MKKTLSKFLLPILLITITTLTSAKECLLLVDNYTDQFLRMDGDYCKERLTPCSTFKIALSLIGYNENILIDETTPEWPFIDGYTEYLPSWKAPHHPKTWMRNSCVWYSQILASKLGLLTLEKYLEAFDYGNQDMSGDPGKINGLARAWLSSSLKISPLEQIDFLKKLIRNDLPVSPHSLEMTKKILFMEDLEKGWKLYGRTGTGNLFNDQGEKYNEIAWLIGWVEKEEKSYTYVLNVQELAAPSRLERINKIKQILKEENILQ